MLTHIHIKNFTIIDELTLDLRSGLTVLTGETGAGKSIWIDALTLALGERADSRCIRPQSTRCEITAIFDISQIPAATEWLAHQAFEPDTQCIFYRLLSDDGRSRSSINGRSVPLQTMRELAELLINICSQNQHQNLLKREQLLLLLDAYAGTQDLRSKLVKIYTDWQDAKKQLENFASLSENRRTGLELLDFYIQEFNDANVEKLDFKTINQEHQALSHAENQIQNYQATLGLLMQDENPAIISLLYQAIKQCNASHSFSEKTHKIVELLNNALVYSEEAAQELRHLVNTIEINPERLSELEEKINTLHQLARKHKINTEDLNHFYQSLCQEKATLSQDHQDLDTLKIQTEKLESDYKNTAEKLTTQRKQAAEKLEQLITEKIKTLGMPQAQLSIQLLPHASPSAQGMEQIDFWVSTNPGQPLQALNKVASGGELSRIALAIQVSIQGEQMTPTWVFDEVDVGIGGATAEIVGKLLRELSLHHQVLCITHLAQVAAQGHHHLQVKKETDTSTTTTHISTLNPKERTQEIARMLGGLKVTEQTLAHAENMLSLVVEEV